MTHEGYTTAVYLRYKIISEIDKIVAKDKEIYKSRSQFINSLLYKFLREHNKVPSEEVQICRIS